MLIHRPYIDFIDDLVSAAQHRLPSITIPELQPHKFPIQQVPLWLFDAHDAADEGTLPPPRSIERFIGSQMVFEMMNAYSGDVRACVDRLIQFAQVQ